VAVLHNSLVRLRRGRAGTFTAIEREFLRTMDDFDQIVRGGVPAADIRAKGDFFNDVLELLLQRATQKTLATRGDVDGLLLDHRLDLTYPDASTSTVRPEVIVETKMAGTPQHPENRKSTPREGRRASQDLDKRIKEAAYKDVDIKGLHAATAGTGGGGGGSLTAWLKSTPPKSYLLLAIRVAEPTDMDLSIEKADAAANWFQKCGLFMYGHRDWDLELRYEKKTLPRGRRSLELQSVLADVCADLNALP
jgi:hypothetical protein